MVGRSDRARRVFVRSDDTLSKAQPDDKERGVGRVKINYNKTEQTLEDKRRRSPKLYATQPRANDLPEACGIGEPVTYLAPSRTPAVQATFTLHLSGTPTGVLMATKSDISQWNLGAAHQQVAGRKRGACLHSAPDAQQLRKSSRYHLGRTWRRLGLIGVHRR